MGDVCSNLAFTAKCEPAILDIPTYILATIVLVIVIYALCKACKAVKSRYFPT